MNDVEDARDQGYRDYDRGDGKGDNPYDWESEYDLALSWESGWLDARDDDKADGYW